MYRLITKKRTITEFYDEMIGLPAFRLVAVSYDQHTA